MGYCPRPYAKIFDTLVTVIEPLLEAEWKQRCSLRFVPLLILALACKVRDKPSPVTDAPNVSPAKSQGLASSSHKDAEMSAISWDRIRSKCVNGITHLWRQCDWARRHSLEPMKWWLFPAIGNDTVPGEEHQPLLNLLANHGLQGVLPEPKDGGRLVAQRGTQVIASYRELAAVLFSDVVEKVTLECASSACRCNVSLEECRGRGPFCYIVQGRTTNRTSGCVHQFIGAGCARYHGVCGLMITTMVGPGNRGWMFPSTCVPEGPGWRPAEPPLEPQNPSSSPFVGVVVAPDRPVCPRDLPLDALWTNRKTSNSN